MSIIKNDPLCGITEDDVLKTLYGTIFPNAPRISFLEDFSKWIHSESGKVIIPYQSDSSFSENYINAILKGMEYWEKASDDKIKFKNISTQVDSWLPSFFPRPEFLKIFDQSWRTGRSYVRPFLWPSDFYDLYPHDPRMVLQSGPTIGTPPHEFRHVLGYTDITMNPKEIKWYNEVNIPIAEKLANCGSCLNNDNSCPLDEKGVKSLVHKNATGCDISKTIDLLDSPTIGAYSDVCIPIENSKNFYFDESTIDSESLDPNKHPLDKLFAKVSSENTEVPLSVLANAALKSAFYVGLQKMITSVGEKILIKRMNLDENNDVNRERIKKIKGYCEQTSHAVMSLFFIYECGVLQTMLRLGGQKAIGYGVEKLEPETRFKNFMKFMLDSGLMFMTMKTVQKYLEDDRDMSAIYTGIGCLIGGLAMNCAIECTSAYWSKCCDGASKCGKNIIDLFKREPNAQQVLNSSGVNEMQNLNSVYGANNNMV